MQNFVIKEAGTRRLIVPVEGYSNPAYCLTTVWPDGLQEVADGPLLKTEAELLRYAMKLGEAHISGKTFKSPKSIFVVTGNVDNTDAKIVAIAKTVEETNGSPYPGVISLTWGLALDELVNWVKKEFCTETTTADALMEAFDKEAPKGDLERYNFLVELIEAGTAVANAEKITDPAIKGSIETLQLVFGFDDPTAPADPADVKAALEEGDIEVIEAEEPEAQPATAPTTKAKKTEVGTKASTETPAEEPETVAIDKKSLMAIHKMLSANAAMSAALVELFDERIAKPAALPAPEGVEVPALPETA